MQAMNIVAARQRATMSRWNAYGDKPGSGFSAAKTRAESVEWYSGVSTVEMAYIMPVILLVFLAIVYATFYYHDKNILSGIAYETAVLAAQKERTPRGLEEGELVAHFQERLENKMILFGDATVNINRNSKYITVSSCASKKGMRIQIEAKASLTEPEKFIRLLRKVT